MKEDYVDCAELSGKTIQRFRLHKDTGDGTELQIDLTDGTSLSYSVCSQISTRPPYIKVAPVRPKFSATTRFRYFLGLLECRYSQME